MPEGVAEQLQSPPMSSSTVVGTRRWGTCPSSSLHPATAVGWPSGWQRGQLRCSFWRWAPACITEGHGPQSGRRGGGAARRTSGSSGSSGSRVGGVGSGGARWTSGSSGSRVGGVAAAAPGGQAAAAAVAAEGSGVAPGGQAAAAAVAVCSVGSLATAAPGGQAAGALTIEWQRLKIPAMGCSGQGCRFWGHPCWHRA